MSKIVDENTTIGSLYKGTEIEYLANLFYYHFIESDANLKYAVINDMCKDLWINDTIIDDLNKVYDLHKQGYFETIYLNKDKPDVCLMHLKHNKVTKTAIIIAGGGYYSVATAIESLPVAVYLYEEKGINVFVLNYSVFPNAKEMSTMDDLACAVKYLNEHQKELNIDITDYMVVGFSAGGHLAASWGTDNHGYKHYGLPKPGIIGLGYPVTTFAEPTNGLTKRCCIGDNPSEELINAYSCEKHVHKDYPKTYVWACENDNTVQFENNSKRFAQTLKDNNIPYILRVYEGTAHGWGLGIGRPNEGWVDEMYDFWIK